MTRISLWYLPQTSTPTLLAIWWLLTVSLPRNLTTIFLSGFVGMFTLEYRANTRSLSPSIRRLEEHVVETLPDKERRLEWFRRKIVELEGRREEGILGGVPEENQVGGTEDAV